MIRTYRVELKHSGASTPTLSDPVLDVTVRRQAFWDKIVASRRAPRAITLRIDAEGEERRFLASLTDSLKSKLRAEEVGEVSVSIQVLDYRSLELLILLSSLVERNLPQLEEVSQWIAELASDILGVPTEDLIATGLALGNPLSYQSAPSIDRGVTMNTPEPNKSQDSSKKGLTFSILQGVQAVVGVAGLVAFVAAGFLTYVVSEQWKTLIEQPQASASAIGSSWQSLANAQARYITTLQAADRSKASLDIAAVAALCQAKECCCRPAGPAPSPTRARNCCEDVATLLAKVAPTSAPVNSPVAPPAETGVSSSKD